MKIIHLFAPGPIGGAEKVVSSGINELCRHDSEVELWILCEERNPVWAQDFQALLSPTVKTRHFMSRAPLDRRLIKELKLSLKAHQGVLHSHAFKAAFYAFAACHNNISHVHTHHGATAHTLKVRLYERLELFIMKRAQQVHAVSRPMEQRLRHQGLTRVALVENPLVLTDLSSHVGSPAKNQFLYVGRLSQEKGVDVLLRALEKVQKTMPCSLKIIGDGAQRIELEALAQNLALKNVEFLGFQNRVQDYLRAADALVMPSRREGLPLTLIESLCSGLPVIASKVGGIPDFVEHGKNGLLSPPEDVDALARNLERFLKDAGPLTQEVSSGVEELKQRFSIEQWAKSTMSYYQRVLNQS